MRTKTDLGCSCFLILKSKKQEQVLRTNNYRTPTQAIFFFKHKTHFKNCKRTCHDYYVFLLFFCRAWPMTVFKIKYKNKYFYAIQSFIFFGKSNQPICITYVCDIHIYLSPPFNNLWPTKH